MFRRIASDARTTTLAALTAMVLLAPATKAEQTEGIKVHGDWTIEIRNPDGTLVSRHEFKNSLTATGAKNLSSVLVGTHTPESWEIHLASSVTTNPCVQGGAPSLCGIIPTTAPSPSGQDCSDAAPTTCFLFPTLTARHRQAPTPAVVLSGTVTAARPSAIDRVLTSLHVKSVATGVLTQESFSHRFLDESINVVPGQIVQVTVVISFS